MKFEQCEKAFFLNRYQTHLKDKVSIEKQLTFSRGHDVGKLAQNLFPNGIDVREQTANLREAVQLTTDLIAQNKAVIYEATFVYNQTLVMVDILVLTEQGYAAYEVKSSLKISSTYVKDACLQYYVLSHVLKKEVSFFLVCLNEAYALKGSLEVKHLFKKRDVTKTAKTNLSYFETQVNRAQDCLKQSNVPQKPLGTHCLSPYTCDFYGHCWHGVFNQQKPAVFQLTKAGRERLMEWFNKGILWLEDLPDDLVADKGLIQQKKSILSGKEIIAQNALRELLAPVNHSVCALDIEVFAPAIPVYQNKHPFESTPFLVTCVGQNYNHHYFKPFREEDLTNFAQALLQLTKPFEHVLVFDASLETKIIEELKLKTTYVTQLEQLQAKLVDVNLVYRELAYFNPLFQSGTGLKTIAQVLFPAFDYSKLAIPDGLQAMHAYGSLAEDTDLFKNEELQNQLIAYCENDSRVTLAFFYYLKTKL